MTHGPINIRFTKQSVVFTDIFFLFITVVARSGQKHYVSFTIIIIIIIIIMKIE